jgi:citrate lyase beta subunit
MGNARRAQPVHTLYVAADAFHARTARDAGDTALAALSEWAPAPDVLGRALGWADDEELLGTVYARVVEKLEREAVEDLRADFEDGYGLRPDAEEDAEARRVGGEIAAAAAGRMLPAFAGIRVKPFTDELRARSARTLELVLSAIVERCGVLPSGWRITLAKISTAEQVSSFADLLDDLEPRLGVSAGTLRLELMVETPQSLIDASGAVALPRLIGAGRGRVSAAHFGVYDFTTACGIAPSHQQLRHPLADFARQMMLVALGGSEVWLSDGSTAVLPVPPHHVRGVAAAEQRRAQEAAVHHAWKLHFDDVLHSLAQGYYQGWDLHPAQLPTRFAALYRFFLSGMSMAAARLRALLERAESGAIQDDPATGQALLAFLARGVACGALSGAEVCDASGLTPDELDAGSFASVLHARRR